MSITHIFQLSITPFNEQPQNRTTWAYHLGAMFAGKAKITVDNISLSCPTHSHPLTKGGIGKWVCWKCEVDYLDKDAIIEKHEKTIQDMKKTLKAIGALVENKEK